MSAPKNVPLVAVLGDSTRLALVGRLCDSGPLSITQLTDGAGMTRQAVTKHLRVLADAGLVHDTRRGRERVWELDPRRLAEAQRSLERISKQWDVALNRLKTFVEQ